MAPFTTREIVAAKRALTVVTGHAALTTAGRVMIERLRRRNLSPLRLPGANIVAFVARQLFVFRMTKANPKRRHHHRRTRIAAELMTGAARRNIAPARLRARRVTAEAGCMRIEISWNRHRHSAARGPVTSRAADTAHRNVARMIELHPKTD
jgi:hypothetical protein